MRSGARRTILPGALRQDSVLGQQDWPAGDGGRRPGGEGVGEVQPGSDERDRGAPGEDTRGQRGGRRVPVRAGDTVHRPGRQPSQLGHHTLGDGRRCSGHHDSTGPQPRELGPGGRGQRRGSGEEDGTAQAGCCGSGGKAVREVQPGGDDGHWDARAEEPLAHGGGRRVPVRAGQALDPEGEVAGSGEDGSRRRRRRRGHPDDPGHGKNGEDGEATDTHGDSLDAVWATAHTDWTQT